MPLISLCLPVFSFYNISLQKIFRLLRALRNIFCKVSRPLTAYKRHNADRQMAAESRTAHAMPAASPFHPAVRETAWSSSPTCHGGSGIAAAGEQALRDTARAFDIISFYGIRDADRSHPIPQAVIAPVPGPLAVFTALSGKKNLDTKQYEQAQPIVYQGTFRKSPVFP